MNHSIIFLVLLSLYGCVFWKNKADYYQDRVKPFLIVIKEDYKPRMVDGVMEPATFPDLDKNQETLLGIDNNHDGIRDDVEIFINRKFYHDYERVVLKKFARHAQIYLANADKMTESELKKNLNQFYEDNACLGYLYGELKLEKSSEWIYYRDFELNFNTRNRKHILNLTTKTLAVGENYGSTLATYEQDFFTCPEKIKIMYPWKKLSKGK